MKKTWSRVIPKTAPIFRNKASEQIQLLYYTLFDLCVFYDRTMILTGPTFVLSVISKTMVLLWLVAMAAMNGVIGM